VGDLTIECSTFTNVTDDESDRTVQFNFIANQDAEFQCKIGDEQFVTCEEKLVFCVQ